MKKMTLLFPLSLFALSAFAQQPSTNGKSTININGSATTYAMPDKAVFNFNISTEAKTEAEVVNKLNTTSNEILKRLKKQGFAEKEIKMTGYSVNAVYNYTDGKQEQRGYSATQNLQLKFPLDKDKVLKMYNVLTADEIAGLNMNFATESSDSLKHVIQEQLMVEALKDAKSKADILAKAAGYKVKSVNTISYNTSPSTPIPMMNSMRAYSKAAESTESSGYFSINEQQFVEDITVSYIIE